MTSHDDLDRMVGAELAGLRRAAAESFPPGPPAAVFATARARAVRRGVTVGVAAAVAVAAILVGGTVVVRTTTASAPPVPPASAPAGTPSPSPTPSPTPSPDGGYVTEPAPVPDRGNDVTFLDDQTATQVRQMTVTLPEWPNGNQSPPGGECPAGEHTFEDGEVILGESEGFTYSYVVLFQGQRGILADVAGDGDDELLVPVGCTDFSPNHHSFELLALARDGAGFRALGYVTDASQGAGGPIRFFMDGDDLVVEVKGGTIATEFVHRRRYRWDGGEFVQVGGPTEAPDPREADLLTVDLRNWSFDLARSPEGMCGRQGGVVSFADGGAGVWAYRDVTGVDWPAAEYLLVGSSRGLLKGVGPDDLEREEGDGQPEALVTLTCQGPGGVSDQWVQGVATGAVVARVGVDGITGIQSHRLVDGVAELSVETADGVETRRYAYRDLAWQQVS